MGSAFSFVIEYKVYFWGFLSAVIVLYILFSMFSYYTKENKRKMDRKLKSEIYDDLYSSRVIVEEYLLSDKVTLQNELILAKEQQRYPFLNKRSFVNFNYTYDYFKSRASTVISEFGFIRYVHYFVGSELSDSQGMMNLLRFADENDYMICLKIELNGYRLFEIRNDYSSENK